MLTIWIHLPSYFQCLRSGHVCVSSCHCQDNGIGVADELKYELSYLKFNVFRLITNRHLEKKTIWNHSPLCLYACMRLGAQEPHAQLAECSVYECMGRERSHLVFFVSQKIIPYATWTGRIWIFLLRYLHFRQPLTQNTHSNSWRSNVEEIFQVATYSSICRYSSETWSGASPMKRNTRPTHLPSLICRKRKKKKNKNHKQIYLWHQQSVSETKSYSRRQRHVKFT